MTFALKLKNKRFEYKLTQKELSEKIGVTTTSIGFIENGSRKPSKNLAIALSKFFNTSIEYWLEEEVTEENPTNSIPETTTTITTINTDTSNLVTLDKALDNLIDSNKVTLNNLDLNKDIEDTLLNIIKLELMQKLQQKELNKLNLQLNNKTL